MLNLFVNIFFFNNSLLFNEIICNQIDTYINVIYIHLNFNIINIYFFKVIIISNYNFAFLKYFQ